MTVRKKVRYGWEESNSVWEDGVCEGINGGGEKGVQTYKVQCTKSTIYMGGYRAAVGDSRLAVVPERLRKALAKLK